MLPVCVLRWGEGGAAVTWMWGSCGAEQRQRECRSPEAERLCSLVKRQCIISSGI